MIDEGSQRSFAVKMGLLAKHRLDHLKQVAAAEKAHGVVHSDRTDGRHYRWIHTSPANKGPFLSASDRHKMNKVTKEATNYVKITEAKDSGSCPEC